MKKVITLLLTLTMVVGMFSISAHAAQSVYRAQDVSYSFNYDEGSVSASATSDTASASQVTYRGTSIGTGDANYVVDPLYSIDGKRVLRFQAKTSGAAVYNVYLDTNKSAPYSFVSNGILNYSFDIQPGNGSRFIVYQKFYANVENATGSPSQSPILSFNKDGKITFNTTTSAENDASYSFYKWYHVDVSINAATGVGTVVVKERTSGTEVAKTENLQFTQEGGSSAIKNLSFIRFEGATSTSADVYHCFDNLVISGEEAEVEEEGTFESEPLLYLPAEYNYNDGSAAATPDTDKTTGSVVTYRYAYAVYPSTTVNPADPNYTYDETYTADQTDKLLRFRSLTNNSSVYRVYLDTNKSAPYSYISSGKVKTSFDIQPGNGSRFLMYQKFFADGASNNGDPSQSPIIAFNTDGKITFNTTTSDAEDVSYTFYKWYHVEIVLDAATGKGTIVVSDRTTGAEVAKVEDMQFTSENGEYVKNISYMQFETNKCSSGEVYTCFDNLIWTYASNAIAMDDTLTILCEDEEQSLSAASPSSDEIIINFGEGVVLDADSLAEKYQLINTDTEKAVTVSASLRGNVLTLIPLKSFVPETTYKVLLKSGITTVDGDTLEEDVEYYFDTAEGELTATLVSTTPTAFAEITEGKYTVTVEYDNTSTDAETAYIIYAYYADDEVKMIGCVPEPITFDASKSDTIVKNVTVPATYAGDVESVKIMLWADFDSIIPISESLTIE